MISKPWPRRSSAADFSVDPPWKPWCSQPCFGHLQILVVTIAWAAGLLYLWETDLFSESRPGLQIRSCSGMPASPACWWSDLVAIRKAAIRPVLIQKGCFIGQISVYIPEYCCPRLPPYFSAKIYILQKFVGFAIDQNRQCEAMITWFFQNLFHFTSPHFIFIT